MRHVVLLLWLAAPKSVPLARATLPAGARITNMHYESIPLDETEMMVPKAQAIAECKGFHLTEAQVRHRFATYREVFPQEWRFVTHGNPCTWDGTVILLNGETFEFWTTPDHRLTWVRHNISTDFSDHWR